VNLTAKALKQHPVLNSRWQGDQLVTQTAIHIGLAIDTDAGLVVPVIRDAASLKLADIGTRTSDLADRARARRLRADELEGGTFSITNLGAFGIDAFTPVINYPECAILGVGRILRQPVAVGDAIGLRDIITLSLTFDHRAMDGAPAARFLQTLTKLIESAN
jgi:pyruvate dehydrogenase E2 component (dihydrolipoamide acetyltransferase)